MSDENDKPQPNEYSDDEYSEDLRGGPLNLSPKMRQQVWELTKVLEYQRRVRVLTERLQNLERAQDARRSL